MDYNKNSKNKYVVLNTHSFTDNEVFGLVQSLNDKFELCCETRTNKGKKVIVIKNYEKFILLVDPYIIDEMRYKLPK